MSHRIEPDSIHIAPLTREHAEDIATWCYAAPYDVYDMVGVDPDELLDPDVGYHARAGRLVHGQRRRSGLRRARP